MAGFGQLRTVDAHTSTTAVFPGGSRSTLYTERLNTDGSPAIAQQHGFPTLGRALWFAIQISGAFIALKN